MGRNRISATSRYPKCPRHALERAKRDRDYCLTMGAIIFGKRVGSMPVIPFELIKMYETACNMIDALEKREPIEWTL